MAKIARFAMRWSKAKILERKLSQPTIFDSVEQAKQQGIEAAYQYANVDWKKVASDAVRKCALEMPEFTTDDVWIIIRKTGITTQTNAALGAIMLAAQRSGMIKHTGNYVASKNFTNHKRAVSLWQSLIYKP
jgi:hypothetical protein